MPPSVLYKNAKLVGDFGDDWATSAGTKVAAVQPTGSDYLYVDSVSPNIYLQFQEPDRWLERSDVIAVTTTPTVHQFAPELNPNEESWNLDDVNAMQILCVDDAGLKLQSFETHQIPEFVGTLIIYSAGVSCEVSYEMVGSLYRIKIKPLQKVMTYTVYEELP